uniref:Beta-defensin n=1 Tax=Callorhinus ursinus TaxID=34884 RepID=A0A3Q7PR91_CALUR|nr:beta-defensin 119 isoform X2 [Callorhinus ursinus]
MKFLFLFLVIPLAMDPVLSGRHHTLRCMGNVGVCRPSCRKTEQPYLYCLNYQPCCLQSYMRISISGREEKNDWSQQNRWPKIP